MRQLLRATHSFLSILSKASIIIAVFIAIIGVFTYSISKDKSQLNHNDTIKETRADFYKIFNDPNLTKTKQDKQMMALYRMGVCGMIGEGCTNNPDDGDTNMKRSLFGMVGTALAYPFSNAPASGMYWTRTSLQEVGFIPKTYAAQGIGFAGLQPILPIWKLMRDAALLIIVLVVMFIGFLIMFRFKINAQTVVSLENSLPKIVISLILIVFSFPIAGFLIDMMYVVTALAISLLSSNSIFNIDPAYYHSRLFSGGTGALFNSIFLNDDALSIGPALFSIMPTAVNILVRISILVLALVFARKIIPSPVEGTTATDVPFAGTIIGQITIAVLFAIFAVATPLILSLLIIGLTAFSIFFRIFIIIFKAYISILLRIIFAPVILMLDAIPGRKMFSQWIRGLIGDLMVIPITLVLIMLSTMIVNLPRGAGSLWLPPFIYAQQTRAIYVLIGMGILYSIPTVYKMAKELIGIKEKPSGLGLGLFLGGIGGVGATGMGALSKFSSIKYATSGFSSDNKLLQAIGFGKKGVVTAPKHPPHET